MPQHIEELTRLLDLEEIEVGLYRGQQPVTQLQRAFGGQVLAQALTAATRVTPTDRLVHSLHAYFLLPGRTDSPIIYDVENIRDGGSFSSRRVVARQHGKIIFYLTASFHVDEPGFEHRDIGPADVPGPDDCPRLSEVLASASGRPAGVWEREWGVLDVRYAGDSRPGGNLHDPLRPALARVWVKVLGELPADQALQRAVLAYASDLTLLAVTTVPHDVFIGSPQVQAASIDHAMWFHRPVRADRWMLYDQTSPAASGSLGLATGRLFATSAAGPEERVLVASVAQEGLIRRRASSPDITAPDITLKEETA